MSEGKNYGTYSAKELLERTMNDAELRERIMQSEPDGIVALAGELALI